MLMLNFSDFKSNDIILSAHGYAYFGSAQFTGNENIEPMRLVTAAYASFNSCLFKYKGKIFVLEIVNFNHYGFFILI